MGVNFRTGCFAKQCRTDQLEEENRCLKQQLRYAERPECDTRSISVNRGVSTSQWSVLSGI
jgi:hypothetical protein